MFSRKEIEKALAEAEVNKGKPFEMIGARTFGPMPDASNRRAGIVVRQQDSLGRRHSNFVVVETSPGLNAAQLTAVLLAHLVNEEVERHDEAPGSASSKS